ncbi:Uncharacterised protein [Candidatus Gugararchaeum adminiculabundum]|nr:Uncharacterised protein [Candidatus Gugararchaeum adminiculabundum]
MTSPKVQKIQASPEGLDSQKAIAKRQIVPIEGTFEAAKSVATIYEFKSEMHRKQQMEAEERHSLREKVSKRIRTEKQGEFVIETRKPSKSSGLIYNQIVKFVLLNRSELKGVSDIENWQLRMVVGNNIIFSTGKGMVIGLVEFGKMDEFTLRGRMEQLRALRDNGAPMLEPIGYAKTSDGKLFMIHSLDFDNLTTISDPHLFTEEQGVGLAKKIIGAIMHLKTFETMHGAPRLSNTFVIEEEKELRVMFIGTPYTQKVQEGQNQLKDFEPEIFFALAGMLNAGVLQGMYLVPEILQDCYGSKKSIPIDAIRKIQGYRKFVRDNAKPGRLVPVIEYKEARTDGREERVA